MRAITPGSQSRIRFPGLLGWCCVTAAVIFSFAVSFKLNGSSVGMWSNLLLQHETPPGLLFSVPRGARFDEWVVSTPAMLSQARQIPAFPIANPSLGGGRAPLLMSVPVAYYTTFFRPQLWGFFLWDFERGFSWYWCCKLFGLLVAFGWMLRQLGIQSRLIVVFGAIWVAFSSYTQWWFSSPAMLPEMLATWAICIGCVTFFFRSLSPVKLATVIGAFVFSGLNFILCLYPPYQIPLLLVGAAVVVGFALENRTRVNALRFRTTAFRLAVAVGLILALLLPFWFDVGPTLEMVSHTAYPGARRSTGGGLSLFKLFSGVLGFFESEQIGPAVYPNISEASNFYPLWLPAATLALLAHRLKSQRLSPLMTTLGIILVSLSVYCVVPLPAWLLSATAMSFSTEPRTLLALGIANIVFCCIFLDRYRSGGLSLTTNIAIGAAWLLGLAWLLWHARVQNAAYFADPIRYIQPLAIGAGVLSLFLWEARRRTLFPILFGALLFVSNAPINPVMRGLAPLTDSTAFKEIDEVRAANPDREWIVYESLHFAQLVKATGAHVFNGSKVVPPMDELIRLDPDRKFDSIYNRYANITCKIPDEPLQTMFWRVKSADMYVALVDPGLPALAEMKCDYAVFPTPWNGAVKAGFRLAKRVDASPLWIYARNRDGTR